MSVNDIAAAFIQHYYTTLDSNPTALVGLYVSLIFECLHFYGLNLSVIVNLKSATTINVDMGGKYHSGRRSNCSKTFGITYI